MELGRMMLPPIQPKVLATGLNLGTMEWLREAARKLSIKINTTLTTVESVTEYKKHQHSLVLMGVKQSMIYDPVAVTKAIRQSKGGEHTVLVGVVRRFVMDREDMFVVRHLNYGMDRLLPECVSAVAWTNELLQLVRGPVTIKARLKHCQGLLTALDTCKDIVQVTDSEHKVTWCNTQAEKVLGWNLEEIRGKDVWQIQSTGPWDTGDNPGYATEHKKNPWMFHKLEAGKTWEGPVICNQRTGERIGMSSKIVSVSFYEDREINYIIHIKEGVPILTESHQPLSPSFNFHMFNKNRKPSYDITSILNEANSTNIHHNRQSWRQSWHSTHHKVPSLMSPELLPTTDSDVTTDLLGALLLGPGDRGITRIHSRMSSSSVRLSRLQRRSGLDIIEDVEDATEEIQAVLNQALNWNFDVIELEKLSEKRPLVWLGMTILTRFQVPATLGIQENVLRNWLVLIEENYHCDNTYHNSSHAADVLQATAFFLEKEKVKSQLDPTDEAVSLLGAILHDVGHPGRNSAFLCNSRNELALLYNDISVLENHHSALAFKLTHSDDRVNILRSVDTDTYTVLRRGIIDLILATDMTKHFFHVNSFGAVFRPGHSNAVPDSTTDIQPDSNEGKATLQRMLIKCSDISNPARGLEQSREWANRIVEEYFAQTDEEKSLGLPVVMPQFDRSTCSIPKSQIGFYDFIIHDIFEAWTDFIECPQLMGNISVNYDYWKDQLLEEERELQLVSPTYTGTMSPKSDSVAGCSILEGGTHTTGTWRKIKHSKTFRVFGQISRRFSNKFRGSHSSHSGSWTKCDSLLDLK